MKYLLFLMVSSQVLASSISVIRSVPEGLSSQKFVIENGRTILEKTSNYFDQDVDYRLGRLEAKNRSSDLKARLNLLLEKIKLADNNLKSHGSNFNSLTNPRPHERYLKVDGYLLTPKSLLYPEAEKILSELQKSEWELIEGVLFSKDLKTKSTFRAGKLIESIDFKFKFYCREKIPPTVCHDRKYGIIYVR